MSVEITLTPNTSEFTVIRDDGTARVVLVGGFLTFALLAAAVTWASTMNLASAALADGRVTVEGNRKAVQHREGGPIKAVLVREGQRVVKGQPLITLDLSDVVAEEAVNRTTKFQLMARVARLRAETSDESHLVFPPELLAASVDPQVHGYLQQESELFEARRDAVSGMQSLLQQQIDGRHQQIQALLGSQAATQKRRALAMEELDMVKPLLDKGWVPKTRILALDRERAELDGALEEVQASLADQQNGIREDTIKLAQITKNRREEISRDLTEAESQLAQTLPRLTSSEDRMSRGILVAPEDGYVFGLTVFGPGAVLAPGQTVLEIVPADQPLVMTVEISPADIDKVKPGEAAVVHLLPYNQRYQLRISGRLRQISSDEIDDTARQRKYYKGIVEIDPTDLANSGVELVPGMPGNVMIKTGERTIMAYFLDPVIRMTEYAFRDK